MIPQLLFTDTNARVITTALSQLYVKDILGTANNQDILDYAKEVGFKDFFSDDTSWCSLFACWVLYRCNCKISGSLAARSWLELTETTDKPVIGDIVILWREAPNSWKGHVGFYIKDRLINGKPFVTLLSGNQSDQVKIDDFPKEKVLGYRKPTLL